MAAQLEQVVVVKAPLRLKLMMKLLFTFLLVCSVSSGFAQKTLDALLSQYNTRSVPYVSVEELRMLQVNSDIAILDSRELEEYNVSHLEGATHIGFNSFSAEDISEVIKDKNTPVIVYCSLGIRSEEIGEKLKKAGFTNIKNLYGGIFEWKNKNYPVLDSLEKETERVHTFSKAWSIWLLKGEKVYNTKEIKM